MNLTTRFALLVAGWVGGALAWLMCGLLVQSVTYLVERGDPALLTLGLPTALVAVGLPALVFARMAWESAVALAKGEPLPEPAGGRRPG